MKLFRNLAAGLAASALVVIAASSFSSAQPVAAPTPAPLPTPSLLFGQPTPPSIIPSAPPTLPPANLPTALPYPAYGSPAPGATALISEPGVPQIVDLNQAVAIGFAKSPILASARGSVLVNTAPLVSTELAFFPSIVGTGVSSKSNRQPGGAGVGTSTGGAAGGSAGTVTASGSTTALTSNSLSLTLKQLIWDGGNLWAQLKGAKATQLSSIDAFRRQAQTVANNVGQAYYAGLAAQRTTAAAVASLKNAETQVALVQAQVNAGTAAVAAVAPLQFQAAQARAGLVQAQGNELTALANFANTLGLDPNVSVQPRDDVQLNSSSATISTIPVPSYDQAVARAILLRPDYDQAVKQLDAAKYNLKAAVLGYAPNLQGTGSYGTASTDLLGGTYRNSNSLGLTLTVPIPYLDQGITEGKIISAKGNVAIAQANLDSTRLTVGLNVKTALIALITAKAKLDQVQAEYTSAVTTLQAVQAQYKVGVASIVDLFTAQNTYTTALVDQVNAAYALRQAEQSYLFSTGEITTTGP
ncbi:MAG TPA: TolC family protein [Candidatus Binatia bacterium]|nr:TolC family protein [Candidatus Binatia bacterium]